MIVDEADHLISTGENFQAVKREALRNALYHTARRRHLDGMGRFLNFVVVIAGAAALADFVPVADLPIVKSIAAAVSLIAGALQLVYDYSGQARVHEFLQRRFYEVLAEIEERSGFGDEQIPKWRAKMTTIYADEPPVLRALDAVAYNEASDSLGGKWRVKVSWLQNLTRQYWAWGQTEFEWVQSKQPNMPAE